MAEEPRALIFEAGSFNDPDAGGWGWIGLVASAHGLRLLTLPVRTRELALRRVQKYYGEIALAPDDPFLLKVADQVQGYFCRARQEFQVDLDLRGHTTFELSVWAAALRIPYGETRTYAWIASQSGAGAGSAQAVGIALGNNPVPLIVPCHRVIGSDGSLHGFGGGLDMKARLLALENQQLRLVFEDRTIL